MQWELNQPPKRNIETEKEDSTTTDRFWWFLKMMTGHGHFTNEEVLMYIYICMCVYIIVSTTTQPNPTRFWDLFRGKGNILSGRCCLWNCEGCEVTIQLESVRKPRSYPESQDLNTWQLRSPEAGYWHIPRRKSDHKTKIRWGTAFVASPKGCILGWRAYGVPMCPVCSGGL